LKGNLLLNHDLSASIFAFDNAIISPNKFITPNNGQDSGLARFIDRKNNFELVFREPVTETPEVADLNEWQRDLSSGKVPDFFRNGVAISGDQSYFYLFLQTEGVLQKINSLDGDLIWEKKFELPEFKDEFDRFVEQNRNNTFGRVSMLQYVHKMEQDENGVYLFLRSTDTYLPTILLVDH